MVDLTQHSPLGGSGAARWMPPPYGGGCSGPVRLSHSVPDKESEYSVRGTAAHTLAANCLFEGGDAWPWIGQELYGDLVVDAAMADGVQVYLNAVRSYHAFDTRDASQPEPNAWIEYEFHCPTIHEYFWGKADFVFLEEHVNALVPVTLHVWDFKNGFMDVEVIENAQLMYYGTGVLEKMGLWQKVDNVVLHICQPNGFNSDGPVREWTISTGDLWAWSEGVLVPAMDRALTSRDTASGEHCRWCPARARACPQILADMDELERFVVRLARTNGLEEVMSNLKLNIEETAPALTDEECGRFKDLFDVAKIACKEVDDTVFGRMMAGKDIPNRKLVKATKHRKWKDKAFAALKKKYGKKAMKEIEIKSPSEIERMLGGALITAEHAFKPDGGLTVVRSDDKRMAVDRDPSKGFKDVTKKGKK